MRRRSTLLAALAAGAIGGPVHADPAELLVQSSQAARHSSYEGVVVFRDERTLEVLRIVHRSKDGVVQERLSSLTGQPRDVLRDGERLSCSVAGSATERAEAPPQRLFPEFTRETLRAASRHYDFRDLGQARIAGRSCRGVAMVPRDEFRYGYEICADAATAVPLKVGLLDRHGRAVEELIFTEVTFPPQIADAAFALPGGPGAARAPATSAAGAPPWQLSSLPPGFRVIMSSRAPTADGSAVDHVVLSDGLAAVSVFGVELAAAEEPLQGHARIGAMNAYGRRVGGLHVTVVGEVPGSTVRLIADGFTAASR